MRFRKDDIFTSSRIVMDSETVEKPRIPAFGACNWLILQFVNLTNMQ
jgi:hypothetical protein